MERAESTLPTADMIDIALVGLFQTVHDRKLRDLLSCLVPVDRRLPSQVALPVGIHDLIRESRLFVEDVNERLGCETNERRAARLYLLGYIHIVEADFLHLVVWNLLRVLNDEPVNWVFTNKTGDTPLQFVEERICDIERRADIFGLQIGIVLRAMWSRTVRNAFAHSQYYIRDDAFWCSLHEMPFANKDIRGWQIIPLDHIRSLFVAAEHYFSTFMDLYDNQVSNYKDGNPKVIQAGEISWDLERGGWSWA